MKITATNLAEVFKVNNETAIFAHVVFHLTRDALDDLIDNDPRLEKTRKFINSCYNPHDTYYVRMCALDEILETCGVEYIEHVGDDQDEKLGLEYLNVGETYATTLIYNHATARYKLASYGDMIEGSRKYL